MVNRIYLKIALWLIRRTKYKDHFVNMNIKKDAVCSVLELKRWS